MEIDDLLEQAELLAEQAELVAQLAELLAKTDEGLMQIRANQTALDALIRGTEEAIAHFGNEPGDHTREITRARLCLQQCHEMKTDAQGLRDQMRATKQEVVVASNSRA